MDLLFIQERMILAGKGQVAGSSPLLASQLERWGGYPGETPPIFLSPQMSYDIA